MTGELFYAVFQTAAGWVGLLGSEAGLRRLTLPQPSEAAAGGLPGIADRPAAFSPGRYRGLIERLRAYYDGFPVDFDDKLDLSGGTDFQRAAWRATRLIPYGETRSYAWVAGQIKRPKAMRAVGQALKQNPLPVIIPCHRVIAGDGSPGGFGGGTEMKRHLITLEMTGAIR